MNILFLPQKSILGASSRVRVYQFLKILSSKDVQYDVISGSTENLDKKIVQSPSFIVKLQWFSYTFFARLFALFRIRKYDVIFLQKVSLPNIFPIVEILILLIGKKVVFDFDDAIYTAHRPHGFLRRFFSDNNSISRIIEKSNRIIVSNKFLAQYAGKFNKNINIIPSSVDFSEFDNVVVEKKLNQKTVIGWIGSPSTKVYLEMLNTVFHKLSNKVEFVLKIIGVESISINNIDVIYKRWDIESYVSEIKSFDIGVMPLTDDQWTKGKAGYKLLQYMAAGVPSVASPVGVNCEIIQNGVNGFLAANEDEWIESLHNLITNKDLSKRIGDEGKKSIKEKFSLEYNFPLWFDAVTKFEY